MKAATADTNEAAGLSDHLGSVLALATPDGDIVESYEYEPYGLPTVYDDEGETVASRTSTVGNRFMFTGREWEPDGEYYHYRHRTYSPHEKRFMQRDPIGLAGGWNVYAYCGGDPVNASDPMGLDTWGPFWWPKTKSVEYGAKAKPMRRNQIERAHDVGYQFEMARDGRASESVRRLRRKVRFLALWVSRVLNEQQKQHYGLNFIPSFNGSCGDAAYKVNEIYNDDPNFRIRMVTAVGEDGYEHTAAIFEPIGVGQGNQIVLDHWFVVDPLKGVADDFGYWKQLVPSSARIALDDFQPEDTWECE